MFVQCFCLYMGGVWKGLSDTGETKEQHVMTLGNVLGEGG